MTKEAYWDSFGKKSPSQLFENKLRFVDNEQAMKGVNAVYAPVFDTVSHDFVSFEFLNSLDTTFLPFLSNKNAYMGKNAVFVPENVEYALGRTIPVQNASHVYASVWVKNPEDLYITISRGENFYASSSEVIATNNDWSKVHLYANIPENLRSDSVLLYIWKQNKEEYWLDNFSVVRTNVSYESKVLDDKPRHF